MPHFAHLVDGVVDRVERIESATMTDAEGNEIESLGQAFLASLYEGSDPADFVLTHYPIGQADPYPRGKYAAAGDLWDGQKFTDPTTPAV